MTKAKSSPRSKEDNPPAQADPCATFPPEIELDDQLVIRHLERHLAVKRYIANQRPAVLARIEALKKELAFYQEQTIKEA
jgi:hypothetical protein